MFWYNFSKNRLFAGSPGVSLFRFNWKQPVLIEAIHDRNMFSVFIIIIENDIYPVGLTPIRVFLGFPYFSGIRIWYSVFFSWVSFYFVCPYVWWLQTYSESRGHNFAVNATFDEVDASRYDGLLIPGGRAPEYLAMNESVLDLVRKFFVSGKPVASICHGQLILAAAGSVKGRKCTAYPSVGPALVSAGANWIEPENMSAYVIDGNLVTAATYLGHPEFIQHFVKSLGGTITGSDKRILFLCGVSWLPVINLSRKSITCL